MRNRDMIPHRRVGSRRQKIKAMLTLSLGRVVCHLAKVVVLPNIRVSGGHRIEANERAQLKDPKRAFKDLKFWIPFVANFKKKKHSFILAFPYKKVKVWHLALMDTKDEMPIEDEKGNGGSNYDGLAAKIPISAGHTSCNFKVGLKSFCEDCSFERDFESANSVVFNESLSDP
ncbi:hypothetical protein Tco_1378603 [Tanacetum coccineum]